MKYAIKNGGIDFSFNSDQANDFMKYYTEKRPIGLPEADAISGYVSKRLARNLELENEASPHPLGTEQLKAETSRIQRIVREKFRPQQCVGLTLG